MQKPVQISVMDAQSGRNCRFRRPRCHRHRIPPMPDRRAPTAACLTLAPAAATAFPVAA
jgi:hypothetical protein